MKNGKLRTSLTHPLEIAAVPVGAGLGSVGLTFCPGKKQPLAMTGAWDRDLGLDVGAIADWGAASVVTLIEEHEIAALEVGGLGDAVEAANMEWHHLPIPDVWVPDAEFERCWARLGPKLQDQLAAGFNVLVHCKGGLGRAGTIASRLLVDAGWESEPALSAVREVRPGSVETAHQEIYVLGLGRSPSPLPDPASSEDRALGAFLGLAVGDALGTTLEFSRRDSKPRVTDLVGGGPFRLQPGEWTDDTAMALALAQSLVADPRLDETDLMHRFVDWYRNGTTSCTGECFDIGITTRSALSRFSSSGNPVAGSTDPHSAGNGSLMRLAPVALAQWQDRPALRDIAARQSATTHGAPEAVDACVAFAELLADAIAGQPHAEVLAPREFAGAPAVAAVLAGSWRGKPRDAIRSSGYVIHSLEAALWCVGRTSSFRSAVTLAAKLGDDADTVAAITGQLAGALYGLSGIPAEWLEVLAWREKLEAAGRELLAS
ncbi:hypothetical protein HMF7854_11190 [Sphingomonas ginkgonis]|uniref:Tyrosine specific protein phosphatases domain-containing protein n=1 Tax=Sphingomonas ginkgonis TaxID=2315330 RepID=A0A3R9Z6Z0_9SPHN|nr:ADP-ribosylglycohydrolase family protein [Sphingomonas ginkgonis]RST31341.1 hypothetical protein HMF7854_11190 [Sphingomonas ginkgonis]